MTTNADPGADRELDGWGPDLETPSTFEPVPIDPLEPKYVPTVEDMNVASAKINELFLRNPE